MVTPTLCGGYATFNFNYHWMSAARSTAQANCYCDVGYTGSNCEFSRCTSLLPGSSLGSMLAQSDLNLRQYSLNFNKTSAQIANAQIY